MSLFITVVAEGEAGGGNGCSTVTSIARCDRRLSTGVGDGCRAPMRII
jgi:hypothetical protein